MSKTRAITRADIVKHVQENARYHGTWVHEPYSVTYNTGHYWSNCTKDLVDQICEEEGITDSYRSTSLLAADVPKENARNDTHCRRKGIPTFNEWLDSPEIRKEGEENGRNDVGPDGFDHSTYSDLFPG